MAYCNFVCQDNVVYNSWPYTRFLVWGCYITFTTYQARRKQNCIGLAFCTDSCSQMLRIRLGGPLGACSPRENVWKFDALGWLLRPFLGLKASLGSLCFSLSMATEFASWPHAQRLVSIGIGCFRGTRQKAAHESQSIFCYSKQCP